MSSKYKPLKPSWFFYVSKRMKELKHAYQGGSTIALYDALLLVRDLELDGHDNEPLPAWVWDGMFQVLGYVIRSELPDVPGPTGNERGRQMTNLRHHARWRAVHKALEEGTPWAVVYERARELLEGTGAVASPGTIKKSYQKVQKAYKDPEKYSQVYQAKHSTRKSAGLIS